MSMAKVTLAPPFRYVQCLKVPRMHSGSTISNCASHQGHRTNNSFQRQTSTETIAAIVTPISQQGAVAIVRLSGPWTVPITRRIFRMGRNEWTPQSHQVQYGVIVDDNNGIIDEVILVPMFAPRSYTREDVVEIQCHGGNVCVRRILQLCLNNGARLAQPGEFTLRAFINGRIDLAQAENVSELIAAKTEAAAETALAGMQGGLSSCISSMRTKCIELLAEMEAHLDFDDELPPLDVGKIVQEVSEIHSQVEEALATSKRGHLLRSGIQVAIVGRPNVGKSSLLNAWSQSERAIVTSVAGTTRDIVEAEVVVGGIPVRLLDTAGIRDTKDVVESIGVQRSEKAAAGADVLVLVVNARQGWTQEDEHIFHRIWKEQKTTSRKRPAVLAVNKIDQASRRISLSLPKYVEAQFASVVNTCAIKRTGVKSSGIQQLEAAIMALIDAGDGGVSSTGRHWAVNERQMEQLVRAKEALERLQQSVQEELPVDFWSVDLRETITAFGQISGEDVSEELLASIFSRFCIGK